MISTAIGALELVFTFRSLVPNFGAFRAVFAGCRDSGLALGGFGPVKSNTVRQTEGQDLLVGSRVVGKDLYKSPALQS